MAGPEYLLGLERSDGMCGVDRPEQLEERHERIGAPDDLPVEARPRGRQRDRRGGAQENPREHVADQEPPA